MDSELVDRNRRNGTLRFESGAVPGVFVCPFRKRNPQPDVLFLASAGVRSLRSQIYPVVPAAYKTALDADRSAFQIVAALQPNWCRNCDKLSAEAGPCDGRAGNSRIEIRKRKELTSVEQPVPRRFLGRIACHRSEVFRAADTFHADRATENAKRPNTPKTGKQPVPILQPILGRRRIGPRTVA